MPDDTVHSTLDHPIVQRGARKPRPLAHVVHLEESVRDHQLMVIGAIVLLLAAFVFWAAREPVAEIAVSVGQVVPRHDVVKVQHFEGGIVQDVLVRDGDHVAKGQELVRLHPAGFEAEEGQLLARRAGLELEAERLRAFVAGTDPSETLNAAAPAYAHLEKDQLAILTAQRQSLSDQRAVLESRLEQRKAEEQGLLAEIAAYDREVQALRDERAMFQQLFDQGHGSRINLLRAQRELSTTEADRARASGRLESVRGGIIEAQQSLLELASSSREEAVTRLGAVTNELAEVDEALRRARDRVSRLTVLAPDDGVVKGMTVHSSGEVVSPGQLLTEIVPGNGELVIDSRIATKDVGSIEVGQPVRVKVTAFDFARNGAVGGRLEQVSATTFQDEDGMPYYRARIVLDQAWVGAPENRILPGMVVQADILTGEKTLIEYLLKPIYLAASQAFTER